MSLFIQILLLDSSDIRNALLTASKISVGKVVNLLVCDSSPVVTAQNVLISQIMFSNNFDPEKEEDIQYFWDVWYSYQRCQATKNRFFKNLHYYSNRFTLSTYSIPPPKLTF
jgi:hypothetical protein